MYFGNTNSRIMHYPDCHHINRIGDINLAGFDYIEDARKEGFRICKCCDPMIKRLQDREPEMIGYCRKRAISYEILNGELYIQTPFSEWKAYPAENCSYDLYHRNTRGNIADYHLQMHGVKDVMAILKYVDSHDNFRINNPLPKEHKKKKKSAPRKGTKKYKAAMRRAEAAKKRTEVRRVLSLIDSLAAV